jgi:hypothetical protein
MYRNKTGLFRSSKNPPNSPELEMVQRTRLMTQKSRSEFDLVSTLGKVTSFFYNLKNVLL